MLHTTLAIHYTSHFIVDEISRRWAVSRPHRSFEPPKRPPDFAFLLSDSESDDEVLVATNESLLLDSISPPTRARSPSVTSSGFWSSSSSDPDTSRDPSGIYSRKAHDPEEVFGRLFTDEGEFDFDFLKCITSGRTLEEVVNWCDVDHYNLLEKAVIYNSRSLVKLLLTLGKVSSKSRFSFAPNNKPSDNVNLEEGLQCFRGAVHLAAFLGCVDIVEEFLDYNDKLAILRGPVHIRPMQGPPSDLFRLIGYNDFTKNPRLAFQMKWIRSHPNERPVHYAICGGYPIIMTMLMSHDIPQDNSTQESGDQNNYSASARMERDALLANLLRQAASCASYNCLATLYEEIPEAMYTRDQRGWLYVSSGLSHGFQFVKFLMETGFAIKLLNNIDGKNSVNALHVFYNSLSNVDGTTAKFVDLYDVTGLLLDLGVDVNMETTSFHSHGVSDTPVHILVDHINFIVSSTIQDDSLPKDGKHLIDTQTIFDDSIRDTLCLILDNGYDIEKHCYSLLKRLFMNRNFLKRYTKSKKERHLSKASYGLRYIYNIARLVLEAAEIRLSPARREVTPALYLIDTLREAAGIHCIFGNQLATQTFNNCLRLLFENGDNANIYPFFSSEDSYLASPLLHLCDLYVDHWSHRNADLDLAKTLPAYIETMNTLCNSGASFTCYMSTRGNFFKHGVFDCFRRMLVSIHRHLRQTDQSLNIERLRVLNNMAATLVKHGAEPILHEYVFRKSHLPITNTQLESKVVGQLLLLGLYCSANQYLPGRELVQSEEYQTALSFHLHLSDHQTYYACLSRVISISQDLEVFDVTDDQLHFCMNLTDKVQNVRSLRHMSRIVIYECIKSHVQKGIEHLPFPTYMLKYMLKFEM